MMCIVSQLMAKKERESLRQAFETLDLDGNGTLTREELIKGYTKMYGCVNRALVEVDRVMLNADIDKNGTIDYSGKRELGVWQSSCWRPQTRTSCYRLKT